MQNPEKWQKMGFDSNSMTKMSFCAFLGQQRPFACRHCVCMHTIRHHAWECRPASKNGTLPRNAKSWKVTKIGFHNNLMLTMSFCALFRSAESICVSVLNTKMMSCESSSGALCGKCQRKKRHRKDAHGCPTIDGNWGPLSCLQNKSPKWVSLQLVPRRAVPLSWFVQQIC